MSINFFTDTIESKFIQSLLYNAYIPKIKTVNDKSIIIKDRVYIHKNSIIKCTKSGTLYPEFSIQSICNSGPPFVQSSGFACDTGFSSGEFEYVYNYDPAILPKYMLNTFIPTSSYYDTTTHEYLGKYLRFLRDYKSINLMPLYNCYSGRAVKNIFLSSSGVNVKENNDYKVIAIPIKFNQEYTIAIDSSSQISLRSGFFNNLGMMDEVVYEEKNLNELLDENTYTFQTTSFKQPILYRISNIFSDIEKSKILDEFEKNLYLLIQIPLNNNSSIVVLEGDYISSTRKVISHDTVRVASDSLNNSVYLSDLSLLNINDGTSHPFADRLIEYLLYNVISPLDEIESNVGYLQFNIYGRLSECDNIWNDTLRYKLFNDYMNSDGNIKQDILGYVDKDMEKFITNSYSKQAYSNRNWLRRAE